MLKGLYTAASGMIASQIDTNIIANNLANVNTPGYQPDKVLFSSFPNELFSRINDSTSKNTSAAEFVERPQVGRAGSGVIVEGVHTTFLQGKLERSDNPLDLGIEGEGFFAINTAGGIRYTRNGSFTLNNEGYLVTLDGNQVMGQRYFDEPLSPIQLPEGKEVKIDEDGKIWVDREIVTQLAVQDFPKPYQMTKVGRDLLEMPGEGERGRNFKLNQGWLEKPDLSVVKEMVSLITAFRVYEANSKAVTSNDQLLSRAINDVGRYIG